MGKYSNVRKPEPPPKKKGQTHDIWRGIGCLMMMVVPVISIALGVMTIDYGLKNKWPIPIDLLGYMKLPDLFSKSSGLMELIGPLTKIRNLYAYSAVSILYMVLLTGVISTLYAIIYSLTGPSRYGPTDAPPPRKKVKRYQR